MGAHLATGNDRFLVAGGAGFTGTAVVGGFLLEIQVQVYTLNQSSSPAI